MNSNYSCDIIQDLLPGYIDGILSDMSTDLVKTHMEQCSLCSDIYMNMKLDIEAKDSIKENSVLDGFRKLKIYTKRLKIATIFTSCILAVVLISLLLYIFVIGSPVSTHLVNISEINYDDNTDNITISGNIDNPRINISYVNYKKSEHESNSINLLIYGVKPSLLNQKNDFSITIPNAKGQKIYLACPDYDQKQIYSWKDENFEKLNLLKDEIFKNIPELNRDKHILSYSRIETVDGVEGIIYDVDYIVGEKASFWRTNNQIVTDGELKSLDFEIWISTKSPYWILVHSYATGEWTENLSNIEWQ